MANGISVELGSLAEFAYQRVLEVLGKDAVTEDDRQFLQSQIGIATQESASVQCVGMPSPIPLAELYQPTRLIDGESRIRFADLLWRGNNAVIFARPGQGKTTLLRWAFNELTRRIAERQTAKDDGRMIFGEASWRPFLCTLRNDEAIASVLRLLEIVTVNLKALEKGKARIALLCDGYDEIPTDDRKKLSQALQAFAATGAGNYFLTCRTFYDVYGLSCKHYFIDDFQREDAERFVQAFSKHYRIAIPAKSFIDELFQRGFQSFAAHPLLLTLVCLLRSGPKSNLPSNSIGLLRRSFEYLRYKWDQEKGVERESVIPLDAEEREHILRKVAFAMDRDTIADSKVRKIITDHLKLIQYRNVNKGKLLMETEVEKLLRETAQFYGLLVPTKSSYFGSEPELRWEFTHNTVRDFLAASYWHQEMRFDPRKVQHWNLRAVYAACLQADSTEAIELSLEKCADVFAASELLINAPRFGAVRVAEAIIMHFEKYQIRFKFSKEGGNNDLRLIFDTEQDIFSFCNPELLKNILWTALEKQTDGAYLCCAYALSEMMRKKCSIAKDKIERLAGKLGSFSTLMVQRNDTWDVFSLGKLLDGDLSMRHVNY